MLNAEDGKTAALREVARTLDLLDAAGADAWALPTRCPGWDVGALAHHVVVVLQVYRQTAERLLAGDTERVPLPRRLERPDRAGTLSALREQAGLFGQTLAAVGEDALDRWLPHPYIAGDGAIGLNLFALEFGLHTDDLACALGQPSALPPDVAHAALAFAAHDLPRWARDRRAVPPAEPTAYLLEGSTVRIAAAWDGQAWSPGGNGAGGAVTLRGDDAALALLLYGRAPLDELPIEVHGDRAAARALKERFPGP